jgi:putative ABC transport system permease protein
MDEMSYDQFQSDRDQIYRMDFTGVINGNSFTTTLAGPSTAETMVADFPEVEDAIRFRGGWEMLIKKKEENINYKQENVVWVDKNFFAFFDIKLLKGDENTVLDRPDALVLSERAAEKFFKNEDPIGQILILDNDDSYEVTGVFENMPPNMHFHYDVMLSMLGRDEAQQKTWFSFNFNTYLKLTSGANPDSLEAKFPALIEKYIGPEVEAFMGQSLEDFTEAGNSAGFELFPMKNIHLYSDKLGELEPNGSIQYVYIFSAIAAFILILACINFMNLSTARSASRAKEVGVRKVMGAYKQHLVYQFLSEAFLIALVSIVIAFLASYIALPFFNDLADKSIATASLFSPIFFGLMGFILVTVGLMAGSYPAFYLSRFKPVDVLKGKLNLGLKSGGIRSTLVVIQFSVSILMMIGTAIVFSQLDYVQNKKLGYDKDQIIMIEDAWLLGDKLNAFKTEVLRDTRVVNGTIASFLPVGTTNNNNLWFKNQTAGEGDNFVMHNYRIDLDYLETLGMEIADGRNFSKDFPSDSSAILLNEAAARQLGFETTVGSYLSTYDGSMQEPISVKHKIVGVVKDFHFSTMRESIEPLIFTLDRRRGYISFKLETDDVPNTVKFIEEKWMEIDATQPFAYRFLDDRYNEMYKAEQRIGRIFGVFAFLAIFIACLGLYGLAAFTAEQKNKEIGIRKVLGASISQIIMMLSKEFIKLISISFVLGSAIAYFTMREWLNEFVYRVDINNPKTFLVAGFLALAIAWLTMSFQSFRAARTNPVNALKDE